MTITDIKFRKLFDNDGPMKAIASVTFDGALAVHDVKRYLCARAVFYRYAVQKNPDNTYRDIVHPINAESRKFLKMKSSENTTKPLLPLNRKNEDQN